MTPDNYGVDPCPQTPKWAVAIIVCGYIDDSVPWISQGYDVAKPKVYVPLDGYASAFCSDLLTNVCFCFPFDCKRLTQQLN